MAENVIKITTEKGVISVAPLNRKASLEHQNNLRPSYLKWKIEEITEAEAAKLPWKDKDFVPASAKGVIDSKNAEIEELKRKLAEAEAKGSSPVVSNGPTSSGMEWRAAIAKVGELTTADEVTAFIDGENRKSVIEAGHAKIEELSK